MTAGKIVRPRASISNSAGPDKFLPSATIFPSLTPMSCSRPRTSKSKSLMSEAAPAFCFPAVAHILGTAWHDQIVHRAEKHVAARERHTAVLDRRQIYDIARFQLAPVGNDDAVNTKTRDAAIGENIETKMGPGLV